MRRAALASIMACLFLGLCAASVLADSSPKATGEASYYAYGVYRTVEFSAHASRAWSTGKPSHVQKHFLPPKGMLHYTDQNGYWYSVTLDCVVVDVAADMAWFSGPVVEGNVGAGMWLFAKVYDGGTPGRKGDLVWGSFHGSDPCPLVAAMANPADGPFAITEGNLKVHPEDPTYEPPAEGKKSAQDDAATSWSTTWGAIKSLY